MAWNDNLNLDIDVLAHRLFDNIADSESLSEDDMPTISSEVSEDNIMARSSFEDDLDMLAIFWQAPNGGNSDDGYGNFPLELKSLSPRSLESSSTSSSPSSASSSSASNSPAIRSWGSAAACVECHSSKTKCDRGVPCSRCAKNGIPCCPRPVGGVRAKRLLTSVCLLDSPLPGRSKLNSPRKRSRKFNCGSSPPVLCLPAGVLSAGVPIARKDVRAAGTKTTVVSDQNVERSVILNKRLSVCPTLAGQASTGSIWCHMLVQDTYLRLIQAHRSKSLREPARTTTLEFTRLSIRVALASNSTKLMTQAMLMAQRLGVPFSGLVRQLTEEDERSSEPAVRSMLADVRTAVRGKYVSSDGKKSSRGSAVIFVSQRKSHSEVVFSAAAERLFGETADGDACADLLGVFSRIIADNDLSTFIRCKVLATMEPARGSSCCSGRSTVDVAAVGHRPLQRGMMSCKHAVTCSDKNGRLFVAQVNVTWQLCAGCVEACIVVTSLGTVSVEGMD